MGKALFNDLPASMAHPVPEYRVLDQEGRLANQAGEVLGLDQEAVLAMPDDLWNSAVARGDDRFIGCAGLDRDQAERFAAARRHDDNVGSPVHVLDILAIADVSDPRIAADFVAQPLLRIGSWKTLGIAALAHHEK